MKPVVMPDALETCWICGGFATSREHQTKKSDLAATLRKPTQEDPLFLYDQRGVIRKISGFKSDQLKFSIKICEFCNNTRTQPHDRAWETLSAAIKNCSPPIEPKRALRVGRIFPNNTLKRMLSVHLFFVKIFGCMIVEYNIPIEIAGFSNAIMNNTAHPNVYLKFEYSRILNGRPIVGRSHVDVCKEVIDETVATVVFATWIYNVDPILIHVIFATSRQNRRGLIGAWHPRQNTTRLTVH